MRALNIMSGIMRSSPGQGSRRVGEESIVEIFGLCTIGGLTLRRREPRICGPHPIDSSVVYQPDAWRPGIRHCPSPLSGSATQIVPSIVCPLLHSTAERQAFSSLKRHGTTCTRFTPGRMLLGFMYPEQRNGSNKRGKQDGSSEAESVLRQTGRGGKFKRERKLVASIEDRNLGFRSNNEMLFHSRMNVMSSMRVGDGFRVPMLSALSTTVS